MTSCNGFILDVDFVHIGVDYEAFYDGQQRLNEIRDLLSKFIGDYITAFGMPDFASKRKDLTTVGEKHPVSFDAGSIWWAVQRVEVGRGIMTVYVQPA